MNKHLSRFQARIRYSVQTYQEQRYYRRQQTYNRNLSFSEAVAAFPDPNNLYAYMHQYFRYRCPQLLREHRAYFMQDNRGFGEDAFHAMWWLLLSEFKPTRMLEIGVYRGQIISLWGIVYEKLLKMPYDIHAISPFTSMGDSVSNYCDEVDYQADVAEAFRRWDLKQPTLVKALSTDLDAVSHLRSRTWDLIYIDGSHDYEIVLADYQISRDNLCLGGLLVVDDASLGTVFHPPSFSFAGHPGPSRVARECADKELRFLGAVGHNNVYMKV